MQKTTENEKNQQLQKKDECENILTPKDFYKLSTIQAKCDFIQKVMPKLSEWKYLQYVIDLGNVYPLEENQGHIALNTLYNICFVCLDKLPRQEKIEKNYEKDEVVVNFSREAFLWNVYLVKARCGEELWQEQQEQKRQSGSKKTPTRKEALEKILQTRPKLTDQQTIEEKTLCMNDLCLIVRATWGITEFTEIIMRQQLSLVAKMNSHADFVHQMYNQLYDVVITILQEWEQINQNSQNQEELQKNQLRIMQEGGQRLVNMEIEINQQLIDIGQKTNQ